MRAMILAAGLGSRLSPLTDTVPKALVRVAGQPMIMRLMHKLITLGYDDFVVNLHHHAGQLRDFLERHKPSGVTIQYSDETDALLDTGGALKRARYLLEGGGPFLVHNVDVWTTLAPQRLMEGFDEAGVSAVLAVRDRETSRYLLFDEEDRLCGWRNNTTGEERMAVHGADVLNPLAFSGIQVIDPMLFQWFPHHQRFSLVDLYLRAVSGGAVIKGLLHNQDQWFDLGTVERIKAVEEVIA
jgi:NDP-sugar pyrophosphorylase family protein